MQKRNRLIFTIILASVFALALALNLLTPLVADDYMYAFRFDTGARLENVADIFPSLAAHARVMNGRLAPHFFVQLFTLLPRQIFAAVNAVMFMLLVLGVHALARGNASHDWKLLTVIAGGIFLLPPAFGQSFLWLAGSVNYLWCDALMVWLLLPFANAVFRDRPSPRAAARVLMAPGALFLGNMSENVSAAAIFVMGLCILWLWRSRRRAPLWMFTTLACAVAGWLLLMLAPANRVNVAQSASGLNALFEHFETALSMWLAHGLVTSLAFILLFCFYRREEGADANRCAFAMGLFIASLLCNFAMTASAYYPERAYTGSCLMQIAACALLLAPGPAPRGRAAVKEALAVGLALVMALSGLCAVPNAYNRYRLAQARVAEVCAMRDAGKRDVVTFGISGNSRFDAFDGLNELTDDASYFPNVYFAKYYGLDSVVIERIE